MTIQEALQNILQAVFGKDVRQSIHDGIDAINKESKADMEAKQAVIDTYTAKQDALDEKYDRLLDEMSQANPSLAEVVDARQNESGTVYTNLKERLDTADQKQYQDNEELLVRISGLDDSVTANQSDILSNRENISNTNVQLTTFKNEVNSYKTTTDNRIANLETDTGWVSIPFNGFSFKAYDSGDGLKYRAIGKIINIRGTLTTKSNLTMTDGSEVPLIMGTLPSGALPHEGVVTLHQGSGKAIFMTQVKADGTINIGRYREGNTYPSNLTSKVWLPINIMYIAK